MAHVAQAGDPTERSSMRLGLLVGAASAVLGGLAWTVKGAAILVVDVQPPLLFEAGPGMFGLWLLSVALFVMPSGRRRGLVLTLAGVSTIAGAAGLVSELTGELIGAALAVSSVALLIGLLSLPRHGRGPLLLAWWLGAATPPALLLGGLLSEVDERLLEVPIVLLGLGWTLLGGATVSSRVTSRE